MADDALLSVNEVARLWGTGLAVVVQLVESGEMRSIDRGLLVAEGRYDIPLIRCSWAEARRKGSPGSERILAPPPGELFHPAAATAFDFHKALDLEDADGVFSSSSNESRADLSPDTLLAAWLVAGSHMTEVGAGIGTAIYSLTPLDAVAARVIAEAPALPRAVTKATPATLIDVLPLVREEEGWRVDLPLFRQREEWSYLLTSPISDSSGADDPGSLPLSSPSIDPSRS